MRGATLLPRGWGWGLDWRHLCRHNSSKACPTRIPLLRRLQPPRRTALDTNHRCRRQLLGVPRNQLFERM